jgi:L-2-hydroxyglutarate oxidase LhgO
MFDSKITIIGAGAVGLAIAAKLSKTYESVFVIERNKLFGQETSSRNSEVIHAGIYYPQNSLKAKLCVEGKKLLYDFCQEHEIPHKKCGKLIVATTDEEIPILDEIKQKAFNNGVDDLRFLDQDEIAEFEPHIFALKALFSPSTGIIESHSYMKQLETLAVNNGAEMVYGNEVVNLTKLDKGYQIELKEPDGSTYAFSSEMVINSAGLESDLIAKMLGIEDEELKIQFCKGQYFSIDPPKNRMLNHLVYPVPDPNMVALGIHVTIDLGGGAKLGPDAVYLDENVYEYKVDHNRKEVFHASVKRFLPFIELDDLSPEMAGLRPKTQKKGEPFKDFYIQEESKSGFSGFINLIGIESPGLTASLAIANQVASLL